MTRIERNASSNRPSTVASASGPQSLPEAAARPAASTQPASTDGFTAARTAPAPRPADPAESLVAIRSARAASRKLTVDAALVQKYTDAAVQAHSKNADHRRSLQVALTEAQMSPDQHAAVLAKGEEQLRAAVAGLKGKKFDDEAALRAKVDAEVARMKFRELSDPLHFFYGNEAVNNVSELSLPKSQVDLLRQHGLRTSYDILERSRTPAERTALRKELGLSEKDFQRVLTHADLTRGVDLGGFYADTLRRIGIDSMPELATRNPQNLLRAIGEDLAARHLERYMPDLERCQNWVRYAQHLPRVMQSAETLSAQKATTAALQHWETQRGEPVRYYASEEAWHAAYQQPGGIQGPWVWRQKQDSKALYFQAGVDDLNHVDLKADRRTGEVTVVGEH